jgi:thioredoxin-like negative regulator of GroEL
MYKKEKKMIKVILTTLLLIGTQVFAAEVKPYTSESLKAAIEQKKGIILAFHADWCGTCQKQEKVMMKIIKPDEMKNLIVFKVDYDKETALKKEYKINKQSTMVALKNGKESSRAIGLTDESEIKQFITK